MRVKRNVDIQPLTYFFLSTICTGNYLKNIIFSCNKLTSIAIDVKVLISNLGSNFKRFSATVGLSLNKRYFNVIFKKVSKK